MEIMNPILTDEQLEFLAKKIAQYTHFQQTKFLTRKDIQERLNVAGPAVDNFRKSGLLVPTVLGKNNEFSQEEFQRFLKRIEGQDVTSYKKMCNLCQKLKREGRF